MIRAAIVDDEIDSVDTLRWKLRTYCPDVKILQSFTNPMDGLEFLKSNEIDLLFLDIEMPKLNGFDILQSLDYINFDVIFRHCVQ